MAKRRTSSIETSLETHRYAITSLRRLSETSAIATVSVAGEERKVEVPRKVGERAVAVGDEIEVAFMVGGRPCYATIGERVVDAHFAEGGAAA